MAPVPRVLLLANGHGEDAIAARLVDRLHRPGRRPVALEAWPMVGLGQPYVDLGVPTLGAPNLLPSGGFATLGWRSMWRDLRAGWIGTHLRQARDARAMRGRVTLAVAIGDVVPLAAAVLTAAPVVFVGCAKSSRYGLRGRYFGVERSLMRHGRVLVFARDRETADDLARRGVDARFAGNPMMDDLSPTPRPIGPLADSPVVGLLPGSRADAVFRAIDLLRVVDQAAGQPAGAGVHFLLIAATSMDVGALLARLATELPGRFHVESRGTAPSPGGIALGHVLGPIVWVSTDRFADALHRSAVVIGLAGTANEQAVGLGKPLLTFPTDGVQGAAFLSMKMRYFGEAALALPPDPAAVARATLSLLADAPRRARMAEAGRAIMGPPGASDAIVAAIDARLESLQVTA